MNASRKQYVLRFCRFCIVLVMLLICAGNITNSVLLKYGFRDTQQLEHYDETFSLIGMMNGTAPKPYVYRSTLAKIAKRVADDIEPSVQQKLFRSIRKYDSLRNAYFSGVPDARWTPGVAIAYHLMYLAIVLATIFIVLIVYRLARMHGYRFGAALGFTAAFSFIYPLTFQQGGYFYDFAEMLGVFGAMYFLLKRRMVVCTLFVALASFNKETFFLVPVALFFLHDRSIALRPRIGWLALQLACCLIGRQCIMSGYAHNAGGFVEVHILDNLRFWIKPGSYFSFYNLVAKGVFTPSLQNPLLSLPLFVFFREAWKSASPRYRRYFLAAFLPLLPLYACFGFGDEVRGLSLAFPAILLLALGAAPRFSSIFEPAPDLREALPAAKDTQPAAVKLPAAFDIESASHSRAQT
ncbi:hypothetical protein AWB78_04887 [Caballeronia calidae]|uniref:Uncharacterized protein n=1 Tax=Caballeronia calidae TaxID=1777139 RepID=A0A158D8T1_9BURK|nr:hypothetical protein [Caballeronia calidae]SAK91072.1 hypothetical protein AWB78_04887 [Caballeronia calidae]